MASFHPVDHELIMCGKTELLLRRHSRSEPFVSVVMFLFCKSGNISVCVCLCCCGVVFKSTFVLNHFECVDLFAVSLPCTPHTEEVMSHFQFQR